MAAVKKSIPTKIILPKLSTQRMRVTIIGDSSLITHRWSEKAKKEILDKQMGKKKIRTFKDPEEDFKQALYLLSGSVEKNGRYGFPAVALKNAAVTVCSQIDGISKVFARQVFHVVGDELLEVHGDEPVMREDMVRVGMGTADIRFRPEFKTWWTEFDVEFNSEAISAEMVTVLFNTAGFGVGLGEWRPEKNGRNGKFHVATDKEMKYLKRRSNKRAKAA